MSERELHDSFDNLAETAMRVRQERDQLKERVEKVMALRGEGGTVAKPGNFQGGFNAALNMVRAILAPKVERRYQVYSINTAGPWRIRDGTNGDEIITCAYEHHARDFAARLNREAEG